MVAVPRIQWRLVPVVLLPFAAGFYLSYLFRTINAVIADRLTHELGLGPSTIGLLTSAYFLAMAAAQVPVGIWLDRHGPRRVQSVCLLVAAAGASLFAISHGMIGLLVGRALIGFGVGTALMSGIKAIMLWFPRDRQATMNGWLLLLGALGAVTATAPAEAIVDAIGWRPMMGALALLSLGLAAVMALIVPDRPRLRSPHQSVWRSMRRIVLDPRFQRVAPLSALIIGTAWSLQSLWAAAWMAKVDGLDRQSVVRHLLVMALALGIGGLALGSGTDRLRRHERSPEILFVGIALISLAAQLALIGGLPVPSYLTWSIIGIVGAGTVVSYAVLSEHFPKELSGQANGVLNLLHVSTAFAFQAGIGIIVEWWPHATSSAPAEAYRAALDIVAGLQLTALAWFAVSSARMRPAVYEAAGQQPVAIRAGAAAMTPYERAQVVYARRVVSAQEQSTSWRLAAIASMMLCAVIAFELVTYPQPGLAIPYVIDATNGEHAEAVVATNGL